MANQKQDTEHYQARANGTEWITLLRKYQGQPGEIRIDEIDEVIDILRKVQGKPAPLISEKERAKLAKPGAKAKAVAAAHGLTKKKPAKK